MSDPNTPVRGDGHPTSPTHPNEADDRGAEGVDARTEALDSPTERIDTDTPTERLDADATTPEYPATAPDDAADETPAAAEAAAPAETPAAAETPEPAVASEVRETPSEPALPPLSQPATAGGADSTRALPDDSALRAAEAARSGEADGRASYDTPTVAMPAYGDDFDDTRLSTPGGARSNTADWTPPPAPVSPTEYPAPATAATPTPYAPPPTGATEALRPQTSTTPVSNLGSSPADSLGFTGGIAGDDDGFTPEELAQRRSVRDELAFRQKQEYAGINFGAGFFGWLAAVGLAGILYLIAGGIAVASGLAQKSVITGSSDTVKSLGSAFDTKTLQITAVVVVLVVILVSYFVGGFVASRMARFSGLKQGLAVWLWGVVMSIIIAVVLVVIVSQSSTVSDLQDATGGMDVSDYTSVFALVAEGLVVVLSIGGALLGGLAGQGFHRKVDRFGIEDV